jgi:hypothetical protein
VRFVARRHLRGCPEFECMQIDGRADVGITTDIERLTRTLESWRRPTAETSPTLLPQTNASVIAGWSIPTSSHWCFLHRAATFEPENPPT